jgi:hypothetical protein
MGIRVGERWGDCLREKCCSTTQCCLVFGGELSKAFFPNIPLGGVPHAPLLDVARCGRRDGAWRYIRPGGLEPQESPGSVPWRPNWHDLHSMVVEIRGSPMMLEARQLKS